MQRPKLLREARQHFKHGAPQEAAPAPTAPPVAHTVRAQTAKEIHKKEWERAQRAIGRRINPVSKEAWAEWREAYASLPPEQVENLESRAAQSKVSARAGPQLNVSSGCVRICANAA